MHAPSSRPISGPFSGDVDPKATIIIGPHGGFGRSGVVRPEVEVQDEKPEQPVAPELKADEVKGAKGGKG